MTTTEIDQFYKHKLLGKKLNQIIKEELETNNYPHISRPHYRRGIKTANSIEELAEIKCRFSIMPRKRFIRGNGHDVQIGGNQIILALHGELVDEEDIDKGFALDNYGMKGRFIIGPSFNNDALKVFIRETNKYSNQIENGQYEQFVKGVLGVMNQSVAKYKQLRMYEFQN